MRQEPGAADTNKIPNKLLESSSAPPRIKTRCGDRWLRAKVLWKNGDNVHPRAHGQCKEPVAGTSWECTRRTQRPNGGRAGVRNTWERWLGHSRRDLEAQLGVWVLPPGVESAEALGNFHSTTGTAAGRADSGRVGGSRDGTAWRLQQGPGARPGSSDPAGWGGSQVHPALLISMWPTLGYQPRGRLMTKMDISASHKGKCGGSPSPSALFQHPLHDYVLNTLQRMTQHQQHILSWEYQWNRGFGGFVTCSFSKPTFKYLSCLGLSVSS